MYYDAAGTGMYLPEGWVVKWDPASGANYYENIVTGESSWTPPGFLALT